MSVVRNDQSRKRYSVVSYDILNENRLTIETRFLLIWCLSKPDTWHFHLTHIRKALSVGKEKLYRMLNELITCGYCQRVQDRVGTKFGSIDYQIFETPLKNPSAEIKIILPQPGFQDAGNQDAGNQPLVNTDLLVSTDKDIERAAAPLPKKASKPKAEKKLYEECIWLTDEQHATLAAKYPDLPKHLFRLSTHLMANGTEKEVVRWPQKIENWIAKGKEFAQKTSSFSRGRDSAESNRLYAETLVEKYNGKGKLYLSDTDEFISIAHCEQPKTLKNIKFKEEKFKETVDSYVKKILEMK